MNLNSVKNTQIERLSKYQKNCDFKSTSIIQFDIETLRLIASYTLTMNKAINRQSLTNVSILFDTIDLSIFKSDIEKSKYIDLIKKAVDSRLSSGSDNLDVIVTMIRGGIISNYEEDEYTNILKTIYQLNIDEIKFVNSTIEACISYLNISNHSPKFIELLSDIENNKSNAKVHDLIEQFNELVNDYSNKLRTIQTTISEDPDFMLSDKELDIFIDDYIFKCENMSEKIITGVKEINSLIGGGFDRERCYVLAGLAGMGKSMVALNFILQIIKYNKNFKTLDKTKTPCIVLITQENTTRETIERFLEILGCKNPTKITSSNEFKEYLYSSGILIQSEDDSNKYEVQLCIKYIREGTVDTNFLYTLYDEYYQRGYEIVMIFQDHIKKMRSALYKGSELRLELGSIVNEYKTFATLKKCSVLTITHLNRAADSKIQDALNKGSTDPLKDVGRDAIGESYLVIDNSDCCLFMHKTYDANNEPFMCFNRVKERFKVDPFKKYIAHPISGPNLIPDLELKQSLSKMSTSSESVQNHFNVTFNKDTNIHNTVGKYNEYLGRVVTKEDLVKDDEINIVTMSDIFGTNESYSANIGKIEELE